MNKALSIAISVLALFIGATVNLILIPLFFPYWSLGESWIYGLIITCIILSFILVLLWIGFRL
ncbi:MAG: hypothetical protein Q6361_07625 [Candidatus Hermodarchaeota archaeon]|nr:hypothetical protein [Candidatus Hermodarchaeota archaeon]